MQNRTEQNGTGRKTPTNARKNHGNRLVALSRYKKGKKAKFVLALKQNQHTSM